jgi:hypothetical protein
MQLSTLEEKLFGAMKGFVARSFDELTKRIEAVERREPAKGDKGDRGDAGRDADPAFIEQQIAKAQEALAQRLDAAVARIQLPKDGRDGKSLTADDVRPILSAEVARMELEFERRAGDIIQRAIEKIPAPVNGKDADEERVAGKVLETVMRALDTIPPPKDGEPGKDADPELVRVFVRDEVSKAVAAMPVPKDGAPGKDGKSVELPELLGAIMEAATKAVASIPAPKNGVDGKDADPEMVRAAISSEVAKAVASIPRPRDGEPGKDADPELVKEAVSAEVAKAVASIPKPKDGEPGAVDMVAVSLLVDAAVVKAAGSMPKPKDGENGKDADPELIRKMVSEAVSAIPKPRDGEHGKDADPVVVRQLVEQAVAQIQKPRDGEDGKDADPELVKALVAKAVAELPKPKDGEDGEDGKSVDLDDVRKMVDAAVSRIPAANDGKDALQIDVLDGIDEQRSYPRNTYATFRGGLVRSFRATDPLPHDGNLERSGWHVVTRGLDDISIGLDDDMRTVKIKMACTDGRLVEETFSVPSMVYRGVYERGSHQKGDAVTWGGSVWVARRGTSEPPKGPSDDWVLAVKRGKDAA